MTPADAGRSGVRHLEAIARVPRPAGGSGEASARAYAAGVLRDAGFVTREEPFEYSQFPGRYATPIGGGLLGLSIVAAGGIALTGGSTLAAAVTLAGGSVATTIFARWMLAHGVLRTPWLRTRGINLVATRVAAAPRVWLVAHLDSKSQPIPSAVRIAGVTLLAIAVVLATVAIAMTLRGWPARTPWWGALIAASIGALPALASVVGERSNGAVDNASGVAAVLAAAEQLPRSVACGVLLSSAEELGLAGAHAWAVGRPPGVALNCDGVDDAGSLVIMYNGSAPMTIVSAVQRTAPDARPRRMPVGLLTDSSALARHGWQAVTVSRGSLATLRRVHTSKDSLATLRGTAIDDVALILARAAEALTT